MKTLKNYIVGVLFISAFILTASCTKNNVDTSFLYTPTSADATLNATLSELQQGRDLFINNCGNCHGLYAPENYTPAQWKTILITMGPKTGLPTTDIQLITKYLSKGKQ